MPPVSKIRVMPEALSNRIAAGEVIERPASVVKELVENAVDAGAGHIRIEIERAGSRLIAVTDDGSGMDADDALLCIEPHGTSKVFTEKDIERITTLGFRGEALPSVASVSRVVIQTRTADSREGTRVTVEGGRLLEAAPSGGPVGTSIQVRDLFYNTPARRKFLKSAATESHHIEECVTAMAIPRPEIAFELILDGRRVFNSPASPTAEARLREFFGRTFADALWPVEHRENGISITGFIASPGFTRNSRKEQRTFINRRAVEAFAIYRGIREGYATLAESGRFPPAILFLEMDPEEVDVNVHPAKREVRFKHEFAITRAVTAAIGNALKRTRHAPATIPVTEGGAAAPSPLDGTVPLRLVLDGAAIQYHPKDAVQPVLPELAPPTAPLPRSGAEKPFLRPLRASNAGGAVMPRNSAPVSEKDSPAPEESPREEAFPAPESEAPFDDGAVHLTDRTEHRPGDEAEPLTIPEYSRFDYPDAPFNGEWPTEILGVFDGTYILAAGGKTLVIIDQHAAHERVMFERLLRQARKGAATQPLLLPQTLELPLAMASLLLRNKRIFEALGFDFEPMGSRTLMLNAIPQEMPNHRPLHEFVPDMLQELLDNAERKIPVELEYVARAACRSAIKAHDLLTPEGARALLRQLGECRQGTLCPHGRPTMITITLQELEKRFFRR